MLAIVLQIFFFFLSHSIYLFSFIVHFIPFEKVAALMVCVLYTIDRRFVITITITAIIPYLTFNVTLFKVCFAAHRSVDGFANVASFFSLIRFHSFYFALDAAHCLFLIRILFSGNFRFYFGRIVLFGLIFQFNMTVIIIAVHAMFLRMKLQYA